MSDQNTAPSPDRRPHPDEVSLVSMANAILRRRRLVTWCALGVFAVVVGVTLLRPRVYSSRASFIPSVGQPVSGLSGLAAQFGVVLPTGEATQSPDFYADLVRSREVLGLVVAQRLTYRADTGLVDGTLLDILAIEEPDSLRRREAGIKALSGIVAASVDNRTGVVEVTVTTTEPVLSQLVALRILDEVNRFNLERRQSRAAAERLFTEQRLDEVRSELRAAEDKLQSFLSSNRDYRNSPVLTFQQQRLERDVQGRQQIYTMLSQALEQARIEAVRDTPVITVVERPEVPAWPDRRGLLTRGIIALVIGLVGGIVVAVILDRLAEARRQEPNAYDELASHRRQLRQDLLRPWRLL